MYETLEAVASRSGPSVVDFRPGRLVRARWVIQEIRFKSPYMARRNTGTEISEKLPKGVRLLHTLKTPTEYVHSLAVTPDGRSVISGSADGSVCVWDLGSGKLLHTFRTSSKTSAPDLFSLAVTPDGWSVISGSEDGRVRVLDLRSGKTLSTFQRHTAGITGLALTPDGRSVISGSVHGTAEVWDLESGKSIRTLEAPASLRFSLAVTPDGRSIVGATYDRFVRVWDIESGRQTRGLQGHSSDVTSVRVTGDGRWIVSTSEDATVRVWHAVTGRPLRTLEGHRDVVAGLSLAGHLAATNCGDDSVRIWDLNSGQCLAELPAQSPFGPSSQLVAFAPDGTSLAIAPKQGGVQIWGIYRAELSSFSVGQDSVRYRNAKVVLVGDTGVGKSGLATVLAGKPFEATDSTHGRKVWLFGSESVPLPGGAHQTREVMLWDLAGQPGYRLVHQLNIDQAVVALTLVDARSETDPLGPAEYWARAIDQSRSAVPITKFLVVARIDRGGLAVSEEGLAQFAQRFGFSGVFQTSAKTGAGVTELASAIRKAIPWDDLEEVASTQLFIRIKSFLQKEKSRGDSALIEKVDALFERFVSGHPQKATLDAFHVCIARLEAAGLVEVLLFSALEKSSDEKNEYVLLQPEYIDAYASAAVMTARRDPRGIGEVLESKLLAGEVDLDQAERIPDKNAEQMVLALTVRRLLDHDIALRERLPEGDYLVFPSEYTRSSPYPRRNAPGVAFDFQGATRNIFTTLVVRLAHHRDFERVEFYRDAACYDAKAGGRCAVVMDETGPGQGRMSVHFEDNPNPSEQRAFLEFVRRHLEDKARPGTVQHHRKYFCRACGHAFDELAVENRLKQGDRDIGCPNCDVRNPLIDLLIEDAPAGADVVRMGKDADAARRRQLAITAIEGKKRIGEYDVFLSYNTRDRDKVVELAEALISIGIRPWLDVWDLVPGRPWYDGLNHALKSVNSAAVCVGPDGLGPWQDHEVMAFIRKFVKRKAPVIPVLLPGAPSEVDLPPLLESFLFVDAREFSASNSRPLANLVAGILGRRPGDIQADRLEELVAAILAAPSVSSEASGGGQQIVIPVDLPNLTPVELEAVRQQTARLLGITSDRLKLTGTKPGSVKVLLVLDDLNALSQLFAMVHRGDPALQEFFGRCQIDQDKFSFENRETEKRVVAAVQARHEKLNEPDTQASLASVPEAELRKWTGTARVLTVAVVFTDIVDSTKLCNDLTDAVWDGIRQQHFKRAAALIRERDGILVKNTGDGILALFHHATSAVEFAVALHDGTGHAVVRIRVGVHVGQVSIDDNDAFGRHVNLAARIMNYEKSDGVTVSDRTKEDVLQRGEAGHLFRWTKYPDVPLKGFPEPVTLWGVSAAG